MPKHAAVMDYDHFDKFHDHYAQANHLDETTIKIYENTSTLQTKQT
jgi:hypothetical protein